MSLRSFYHLRVRRGGAFPDVLLPTVLLLNAEDASLLREDMGSVLKDVTTLLIKHGGEILPELMTSTAAAMSNAYSHAGMHHGKGNVGGAPFLPVAALSSEVTFAGAISLCAFSSRPLDFTHSVMHFGGIGMTVDTAEAAVEEAGQTAISSSSSASSASVFRDEYRGDIAASSQLTVRVTHKAAQAARTEAALAADPGKLNHYIRGGGGGGVAASSSSSSASSAAAGGGGAVAASSSSSSSAAAALAAASMRPNARADIPGLEDFIGQKPKNRVLKKK